jgi:hypothetical protein
MLHLLVYVCHVLYSKLHNNLQPKIKCELNTFTIPIVMNPKTIVKLDAPKILHSCHQQLLLYAPNKILNTLFILNGLVHGGLLKLGRCGPSNFHPLTSLK